MNIVVYCSSSENLGEEYTTMAQAVGKAIGDNHCNLLYGGVDAGLMHTTAQAAHDAGATIIGVVPERFKHRADKLVDSLILCSDLNDRKAIMIEQGDIFVVLPGGIGTIDELVSTLSIMKVNCDTRHRIVVVNLNNCFDGVLQQLKTTAASPFNTRCDYTPTYSVACSQQELIDQLTLIINNYDQK